MAEIVPAVESGLQIGALIEKYVVIPITNQFRYVLSYNTYIQNLTTEVNKLNQAKDELQSLVDAAKRNNETINRGVCEWLQSVDEINGQKEKIRASMPNVQKGCFNGWCPNVKLRYYLSRDADKVCEAAIQLCQRANFTTISHPSPPQPYLPLSDLSEFESRKYKEEEIIAALKDADVYMIGVCGMGGVGKTTMVKKIMNTIIECKIFDEVAMATASENPDLLKIQQEVAEPLGLTLKNQTLNGRATELYKRLTGNEKKALIVLDDVWEKLDLDKLGIPHPSNKRGCKIIVTSRVEEVCKNMESTAIIVRLELLPKKEAWVLFRQKAGDTIDAAPLHSTAQAVANECKGLPLALVILGSALRNNDKCIWDDALLQLQSSIEPVNIPGILKDLYVPLQVSYDMLVNKETKYLFLFCCLFPEDYDIPITTLMRYGKGLDIFRGTQTLEQARNRVKGLISILKGRFLLMNSETHEHETVKMHDIVRDMALYIASKGEHVFLVNHRKDMTKWPKEDSYDHYTCISLSFQSGVCHPERLNCNSLVILRLKFKNGPLSVLMPEEFFKGMRRLKVLEIDNAASIPTSLQLLMDLRVLHLHDCRLDSLSFLTELHKVEIVSLQGTEILHDPEEINGVLIKSLKSLDLTNCPKHRIPTGILPELLELEELFVLNEKDVCDSCIISLNELSSLKKLTTLEIYIPDPNLIPQEFAIFEQNLTRYYLVIGRFDNDWKYNRNMFNKAIYIGLEAGKVLGDWTYAMAKKADCIKLRGSWGGSHVVTQLLAENHSLKKLNIENLDGVEHLYEFPVSSVECLSQLESLEIRSCPSMKQVYMFKQESEAGGGIFTGHNMIKFPKLQSVNLIELESLSSFCKGFDGIEFPMLHTLKIRMAPKLAKLSCIDRDNNMDGHSVFNEKVVCPCLEKLVVEDCAELKEIIRMEENEEATEVRHTFLLPRLRKLELCMLPKLHMFPFRHMINNSQLASLSISRCPDLVVQGPLFVEEVAYSNLSFIRIESTSNQFAAGVFGKGIPMGKFDALRKLSVVGCGLRSLLFFPMFRGLSSLEYLRLENCTQLEQVIAEDDDDLTSGTRQTVFPQLDRLELKNLPNCRRFCHISNALEFPSLKYITIHECPIMDNFSAGPLSLPSLEFVKGISDPNLASRILFHKERCDVIEQTNNDCFWLGPTDFSIIGDHEIYLGLETRQNFASIISLGHLEKKEISWKFDTAKLSPRVVYEIVFQ